MFLVYTFNTCICTCSCGRLFVLARAAILTSFCRVLQRFVEICRDFAEICREAENMRVLIAEDEMDRLALKRMKDLQTSLPIPVFLSIRSVM